MSVASTRLRAITAGALVASVAACADSPTVTAPEIASLPAARLDVVPAPGTLIIPGVDGGMFTNTIVANNSGRATTEFFDNPSADNTGSNSTCGVAFWATGTPLPGCQNEAPGSTGNQGGYTHYWGDGPGGRDASSFMVNGNYQYVLTLEGSYAGLASTEVGWFTRSNLGVYTFHNASAIASRNVGAMVTVPAGANWGFYIRNSFNSQTGGCQAPDYDCSDATGGFTMIPLQQWALMRNGDGTRYLAGGEDNRLEVGPTADYLDSDYNDYIISFGLARGCSPGYWKNHLNWPVATNTRFDAIFADAFGDMTLLQVVSQNGGGLNALGRHTVSAYLNALAFGAENTDFTAASIVTAFNAAYASGNYNALNTTFEGYTDINGRVCGRG